MTSIAHFLALPRQLRTLLSALSLVRATLRLGLLRPAACWALICLTACAAGPKMVTQSFSIDGWNDGWATQVDLLEYSYGDYKRQAKPNLELGYSSGVTMPMRVPDFLYVKWRLKATGEVIEDRVDLQGRLPADMYMQQVTFVIDGHQLFVYLVTPTELKQPKKERPLRTWLSKYNVTYEIYPTNQLKKTEA